MENNTIACVCFADETHEKIIDQQEIKTPFIVAHEEILAFIRRNTKMGAKILDFLTHEDKLSTNEVAMLLHELQEQGLKKWSKKEQLTVLPLH